MADSAATTETTRRRPSPGAVLAIVGFAVFVAADDLTVVTTMLRPIINDLGLVLPDGLDDAAWIVNAYLIAFVAIMPIAGRLSDVIGRRNTFVGAYLVFLVGTTMIPLTSSLGPFLVARVLTALGGGAMVPVALAVVGDVYPEHKRARALGTLGAIETMGWVWGPLYGAVLVRFLSWEWQFWLNIPLAGAGLALVWWALDEHEQAREHDRVDWIGAAALTITLVSLNLALLGNAEIQSVSGLDELTGGSGPDYRWLYLAAAAGAAFLVWHQRRVETPLIDARLFQGRNLRVALVANFIIGAVLVIAMVDVPIFVNAVEVDIERSAVVAGWILSALTAAMALTSYLGGRVTERTWYRPPVLLGMAAATLAFVLMGLTWEPDTSRWVLAAQLTLLGAGLGMVVAPTTSAVVDASAPEDRGAAAGLVMVVRLIGLSVGLSALTAWGLARFNALRRELELPAITDPDFEAAALAAQADLTADALGETFLASAALALLGLLVGFAFRRASAATPPGSTAPVSALTGADPTVEMPDETSPDTAAVMATGADPTVEMPVETSADTAAVMATGADPTVEMPVETSPDTAAVMATGADPTIEMPQFGVEPPTDFDTEQEAAMPSTWFHRNLGWIVGFVAVALITAFALVAALWGQLQQTRDDLADTEEDLARVEAGAALFASQVQGFQDQLVELEPLVSEGIDEAIAGLDEFSTSTLEFTVNIDETVTIDTEVVLDRNVVVPINETLPINETFDTTITVNTPLGFDVDLDVTVPVNVDVPIDLELDIPVNETVPISASVPVNLDVPIRIDIADTELASLSSALADGLRSFREVFSGLGG